MDPSRQIDELIAEIPDWRGAIFATVRKTILASSPEVVEEFKWMGSPLWSCDGMIAVANAFKSKVNVTFAYGAKLPDPKKLFNSGFGGNTRRAIDYFEGDTVDERALKALVLAAIEYNRTNLKKNAAKASAKSSSAKKTPAKTTPAKKTPAKANPAKRTPAKTTPAKKTAARARNASR